MNEGVLIVGSDFGGGGGGVSRHRHSFLEFGSCVPASGGSNLQEILVAETD